MIDIEKAWRLISARLGAASTPTPLVDLPNVALRYGVERVLVKDESRRPLGNFKVLGGVYASLCALARATGETDIETLLARPASRRALPGLVCASDGNHGLAVATGGRLAGTTASIYLPEHVSAARAQRIADSGGKVVWVKGTYDDAVAEAAAAAGRGDGLLIADTTSAEKDAAVADVMAGYGIIASEIAIQLEEQIWDKPTHLFVQAGVGGLAAAMAEGLHAIARPLIVVVVEPDAAACVGAALNAGRAQRITGSLETVAEMLSCGEASAPALTILLRHEAVALKVSDEVIKGAADAMRACGGPATTPSGATGLAGLIAVSQSPSLAKSLGVGSTSRILLIATERSA